MDTQCNSVVSLIDSRPRLASRRRQIRYEGQLNAGDFERFLYRLGPDPETAGQKYESIRGRLITMFRARRCASAEDLADATFERVARKLSDLTTEVTGDPARYFYGVAKKIYLEYRREITANQWKSRFLLTSTDNQDLEFMLNKLDEALSTIPEPDRELILSYYTGDGKTKINRRRALAAQSGIGTNALRLRVFRIRKEIKNYILKADRDAFDDLPKSANSFHRSY